MYVKVNKIATLSYSSGSRVISLKDNLHTCHAAANSFTSCTTVTLVTAHIACLYRNLDILPDCYFFDGGRRENQTSFGWVTYSAFDTSTTENLWQEIASK